MENLTNEVLSKEQAIKEIQKFVQEHDSKKKEDYQIEDEYPHVVEAVTLGLLSFDKDLKPKFTLRNPILNEEKEIAVAEIEFRTRIKPQQLADIMKGLDIAKNQIEYTLRCLAYLTKQPKAMLDKFSKFDYKVIEQVSTVFL